MQNIKKDISDLRKLLPHGAVKEIAEMSNVTIFTVSRVLNGKSKNIKVIRAIGNYVTEIMGKNDDIKKFIDQSKG